MINFIDFYFFNKIIIFVVELRVIIYPILLIISSIVRLKRVCEFRDTNKKDIKDQ